ncbi:hypothetical protein WHR41_09429 [Cladosporium halotolerans]|uniref:C2H2-type domain-containing protein n=1 Tax=Cladosporium halotolerans TaxID=1052096 RepID=A0AB34KF22_9PEZI
MSGHKDISRQIRQSRPSVSSTANSLPTYQSYKRTHFISLGASVNGRISRRKSSYSAPSNAAAIEATVDDGVEDGSVAIINSPDSLANAAVSSLDEDSHPAMPSSLPTHRDSVPNRPGSHGSSLAQGQSSSSIPTMVKRSASHGTGLTKEEKAAKGELDCEHCGKAYKNGSCLTKHLWEHTPQWQYTSKLQISKHQQVELLEAASVLISMNQCGTGSDGSDLPSPAASRLSDVRGEDLSDYGFSSVETAPTSQSKHAYSDPNVKRYRNSSRAYSPSFQSSFSEPSSCTSGFSSRYRRQSSSSIRPANAAEAYSEEDATDSAAAVALLSCSYGTPKSGPAAMPADIPFVQPLPAIYQGCSAPSPASREPYRGQQDDVDIERLSDEDAHVLRHHHHEEEDECMFGKMDT